MKAASSIVFDELEEEENQILAEIEMENDSIRQLDEAIRKFKP